MVPFERSASGIGNPSRTGSIGEPAELMPAAEPARDVKEIVNTNAAPEAVGAYSQATTNGELAFTAGQIPLTPDGELLDDAPIAEQTEQALDNVTAVLAQAGASMGSVLKMTVYLDDIEDFEEMNETYATYFESEPPARSAVEVGALPKGVGVEVEAVAAVEE
jgi:reactive intermediate/imine deaminase